MSSRRTTTHRKERTGRLAWTRVGWLRARARTCTCGCVHKERVPHARSNRAQSASARRREFRSNRKTISIHCSARPINIVNIGRPNLSGPISGPSARARASEHRSASAGADFPLAVGLELPTDALRRALCIYRRIRFAPRRGPSSRAITKRRAVV